MSPPSSFPKQLHKLQQLNINAQTNIFQAQDALKDYIQTIKQIRLELETNERNMIERSSRLRRTRYQLHCDYS